MSDMQSTKALLDTPASLNATDNETTTTVSASAPILRKTLLSTPMLKKYEENPVVESVKVVEEPPDKSDGCLPSQMSGPLGITAKKTLLELPSQFKNNNLLPTYSTAVSKKGVCLLPTPPVAPTAISELSSRISFPPNSADLENCIIMGPPPNIDENVSSNKHLLDNPASSTSGSGPLKFPMFPPPNLSMPPPDFSSLLMHPPPINNLESSVSAAQDITTSNNNNSLPLPSSLLQSMPNEQSLISNNKKLDVTFNPKVPPPLFNQPPLQNFQSANLYAMPPSVTSPIPGQWNVPPPVTSQVENFQAVPCQWNIPPPVTSQVENSQWNVPPPVTSQIKGSIPVSGLLATPSSMTPQALDSLPAPGLLATPSSVISHIENSETGTSQCNVPPSVTSQVQNSLPVPELLNPPSSMTSHIQSSLPVPGLLATPPSMSLQVEKSQLACGQWNVPPPVPGLLNPPSSMTSEIENSQWNVPPPVPSQMEGSLPAPVLLNTPSSMTAQIETSQPVPGQWNVPPPQLDQSTLHLSNNPPISIWNLPPPQIEVSSTGVTHMPPQTLTTHSTGVTMSTEVSHSDATGVDVDYMSHLQQWYQQIEDYDKQMQEYFQQCAGKLREWHERGGEDTPEYRVEYAKLTDEYDKFIEYMKTLKEYYNQQRVAIEGTSIGNVKGTKADTQKEKSPVQENYSNEVITTVGSVDAVGDKKVTDEPTTVSVIPASDMTLATASVSTVPPVEQTLNVIEKTVSTLPESNLLFQESIPPVTTTTVEPPAEDAASKYYADYYKQMIDYFSGLLNTVSQESAPQPFDKNKEFTVAETTKEASDDENKQTLNKNQRKKLKKKLAAQQKSSGAKKESTAISAPPSTLGNVPPPAYVQPPPPPPPPPEGNPPLFDPSQPPPGYTPFMDPQSMMRACLEQMGTSGQWDWRNWNVYMAGIAHTHPQWYTMFQEMSQSMGFDWAHLSSQSNAHLNLGYCQPPPPPPPPMDMTSTSMFHPGSFQNNAYTADDSNRQPIFDKTDTPDKTKAATKESDKLSVKSSAVSDDDESDDDTDPNQPKWCKDCEQQFSNHHNYTLHLRGLKHMHKALENANKKNPEQFREEAERQRRAAQGETNKEGKHLEWVMSQFRSEKRKGLGLSGSFYCTELDD